MKDYTTVPGLLYREQERRHSVLNRDYGTTMNNCIDLRLHGSPDIASGHAVVIHWHDRLSGMQCDRNNSSARV